MFGSLFSPSKEVKLIGKQELPRWEKICTLGPLGMPVVSALRIVSANETEQIFEAIQLNLKIVDSQKTRTLDGKEEKIYQVELLVPADTDLIVAVVS